MIAHYFADVAFVLALAGLIILFALRCNKEKRQRGRVVSARRLPDGLYNIIGITETVSDGFVLILEDRQKFIWSAYIGHRAEVGDTLMVERDWDPKIIPKDTSIQ